MEKGIFNQAYFREREREREKGKTKADCAGCLQDNGLRSGSLLLPSLPHSLLSWLLSGPWVFSPLHPVGTYGTELSSSIFSVSSVSAPKLK